MAPELKRSLIYNTFSYVGLDEEQNNIGGALICCFFAKEQTYHALAYVTGNGKKKCTILSNNLIL